MRRLTVACSLVACSLAVALPEVALGGAPGWSTPHTATPVPFGIYGAGPNGQSVQLFGSSGASQSRVAMMRAIKSDATQGSAVTVDANGRPGFGSPAVDVNAAGKLVAAWNLDTLSVGPIGIAAALGARTALPRTATVLPTTGNVGSIGVAIGTNNTAVVAWAEDNLVRAATMRANQPPIVATLATAATPTTFPEYVTVGLDASGKPTVTWLESADTGSTIGVARGDGLGAFAPATKQMLTTRPETKFNVFVQNNGGLAVVWFEDTGGGPVSILTATAPPSGAFGASRTVGTASPGPELVAAGAGNGRIAVFYPVGSSSSGVSLHTILRSTSGNWGTPHAVGPSKRSVGGLNVGVDAKGRVVVLWSDGSAGKQPNRILAARSSSSSDPPGTYHQLPQRSGDKNCNGALLWLSTSGDGLGSWNCNVTKSNPNGQPRLARLTAAS